MSITRAEAESILIRRAGALIAAAGLDGSTVDGTNADLNDPLGWAVRQAGGSVSSPGAVADADLATVADDDLDQLLDLAEVRTLESIAGNLDLVNITVGSRREELGALAQQVERAIERKRAALQRAYGFGLGSLTAGSITLGFAETTPTSETNVE